MNKISNLEGVKELALKVRNWGRWGSDDQIGTLNFVTPEKIAKAATLVKKGKIFPLGIPLNSAGPQRPYPVTTRFNPIHVMLRTGTDAAAGASYRREFFRGADDMVILATHGATQWDALSHVFYEGKMWNGYDCSLVTSQGASKNGIENLHGKICGRGVLLDIAEFKKVKWLDPGYGITPDDLEKCAVEQEVKIESGDLLLVRTGQMRQVKERNEWEDYAGGDAPGLSIETAEWLHDKEVACAASDTWGVEVRPNVTADCYEPWHVIVIPNMGLLVGEIFDLEALAQDCRKDRIYEFMFVGPSLPISGGIGSPIDPYVIK